ncbi:MAG: dihydropteroate synthase [Parvibaculales bacterium]
MQNLKEHKAHKTAQQPSLFGILNITADSFSDGGCFIEPQAALRHAEKLSAGGAQILDIGAASSHPDAQSVSPQAEIARLAKVWPQLKKLNVPLCVDSFQPQTQSWAMAQGTDWLNDINGFAAPALYDELADSACRLVVMHAIQAKGIATRSAVPHDKADMWARILRFFAARLADLQAAGIDLPRLVLAPGLGYFLGTKPHNSLVILADIGRLKQEFGLPVLVSVSRKSFVRQVAGVDIADSQAATLAAELWAAAQGVDYIRTHNPAALVQALKVNQQLVRQQLARQSSE